MEKWSRIDLAREELRAACAALVDDPGSAAVWRRMCVARATLVALLRVA